MIAEEVATVYPDLVTRNAKGEIEGVRYDELAPLLLNAVQHQQSTLSSQAQQLTVQKQQLKVQAQEIAGLKVQNEQLQAALAQQNAALLARLAQVEAEAHKVTVANR